MRSSDPCEPPDSSNASEMTSGAPFSSALQLQIGGLARYDAEGQALGGRVREGVIERLERLRARDVELERVIELRVGDDDLGAVGRLAPEEGDHDAVVLAARQLAPVGCDGCCVGGGVASGVREAHVSS